MSLGVGLGITHLIEDPLKVKDGAERMEVRNVGSTVYVKYLNFSGSIEQTFTNVSRVVVAGGAGWTECAQIDSEHAGTRG